MQNQVFNTFWYGEELPPLHWACLRSFVECGHRLRVFAYQDLEVPAGVSVEDARQILSESELFEFESSFSAFSNIFRYKLLLEQGGWWVDTDVYCLKEDIPDCAYAWARQEDANINGAILKFPAGDPTLDGILREASTIGRSIKVWGELGPSMLTKHLHGRSFSGHYGSTADFYPIHYFETPLFWLPDGRDLVLSRCAEAPFVHLWGSMFSYYGIDVAVSAPAGSFFRWITERSGFPGEVLPLNLESQRETLAAIRAYQGAGGVREQAVRALGYDPFDAIAPRREVSVVIPTYNMAWCVERAVASCLTQSVAPAEIIIVDDCSTDNTQEVVQRLMEQERRVKYHRLPRNVGHLDALHHGLQASRTYWTALLDADDEMLPHACERRIDAADCYFADTGRWPQLVYGDLYWEKVDPSWLCRFQRIRGHAYEYLSRELSLCQTSTIMLGRDVLPHLPTSGNPYNTDDEIVLAVARQFPLVHCDSPVAVTHNHSSETRMTNSLRRRLRGISQLVREHRKEILRLHGVHLYLLWRLRVLSVFLEWQSDWSRRAQRPDSDLSAFQRWIRLPLRGYSAFTRVLHERLTAYLGRRFDNVFF